MNSKRFRSATMRTIPSIESVEAQALRNQQSAFCILTLFVIAILLLLHSLFAALLGEPSNGVVLILAFAFLLKMWEALWLQGKKDGISAQSARIETAISIIGLFTLAAALAFLTNRDDAPYFVLLAIPILQCAYQFGILLTITTIIAAVGLMFAWIQYYFGIHPPPRPTEYLETGMVAVLFCLTGPLVWYLVNQLKEKESKLREQMTELESAREMLVAEERLAAVGRLASGIAHEIRNPVAMIASSLATAAYPGADNAEREEMFSIAEREAKRLENLTGEFLTYARPSKPQCSSISIDDIVRHISDVTRMRAAACSIEVSYRSSGEIHAEVDPAQIEGALLNLSLNALDATPAGGRVELRARSEGTLVCMEVEDSGKMIPDSQVEKVFEPFFTTKPGGTGLGLAIARGVAIAHGGDLWISSNKDGAVVFTMTLSKYSDGHATGEAANGEDSNS